MKNLSESFIYGGSFNSKASSNKVSNISNNEIQYSAKFNTELSWIKANYSSDKLIENQDFYNL